MVLSKWHLYLGMTSKDILLTMILSCNLVRWCWDKPLNPFYIEPTGYVNTFAVRFYPYGFANFVSAPIKNLANKETPIEQLFGRKAAEKLAQQIIQAGDVDQRIGIIESFLLDKLSEKSTVDTIVKTTIDTLLLTKGSASIRTILKEDISKRRQLERKFVNQIGISPKQLGESDPGCKPL